MKIKATKGPRGEDYEADPQIDDDPDLVSPGPGSFSSPASGKRRIQEVFDLEAQESARRAAGKAAVKKALAGNMAAAGADPFSQIDREPSDTGMHKNEPGAGWRFLVNMLIIFPWSMVLLLSWAVNKWQLIFRPIGQLIWWSVDQLDQRAPGLVEWLLWLQGLVSLALHVITIGINLGVIWIMWSNGDRLVPICVVTFYSFAHYAMAVTMFKELDLREQGGTYFSDVVSFAWRVVDVLFFDIQMCASVVHSNRMMESMTQLMFKGYEEARVALTTLLFTVPCCILIGVEYGVFNNGELVQQFQDVRDLNLLTDYRDQLWAAVCFSVINSIEKILRFSLVDPWLHEKGDGFPILYVRSHAARLPGGLVRDWLFRCKEMLEKTEGRLVLKAREIPLGGAAVRLKGAAAGLSHMQEHNRLN